MGQKREKKLNYNLFPKNNRGQFFLIAAVVIIVVIVSLVTVSNYTSKKDNIKLYDLGKELGIESQHVLDYGTYSQLNEDQMKELMATFIKNYVQYIGGGKNIYFIYGNSRRINVVGYQDILEESVEICLDNEECFAYTDIGTTIEYSKTSGADIHKVFAIVGDTSYDFTLKEGENFYFIIWQELGGDKIVVTNREEETTQQGGQQ